MSIYLSQRTRAGNVKSHVGLMLGHRRRRSHNNNQLGINVWCLLWYPFLGGEWWWWSCLHRYIRLIPQDSSVAPLGSLELNYQKTQPFIPLEHCALGQLQSFTPSLLTHTPSRFFFLVASLFFCPFRCTLVSPVAAVMLLNLWICSVTL